MPRSVRLIAGSAAIAMVAALLTTTGYASAQPELPIPVTSGAIPTPQTDGIVFDVKIVGDTVYAGGRFDKARPFGAPPGVNEVPRRNLLAFNIHTGQLLDWAPTPTGSEFTSTTDQSDDCRSVGTNRWVCDSVYRIETDPSGQNLYIGGDFDKINGIWRSRLAAFNVATGAMTSFNPTPHGRVRALSVTANAVYFGGWFSAVKGVSRSNLAAVNHAGQLLDWAPTVGAVTSTANREIWAILARPDLDRVIIGGSYDRMNGATRRSMTAVNATSGANVPWPAQPPAGTPIVADIVSDGSGTAWISALDYAHGGGALRFEGRMAVNIGSGQPLWWDGCRGDTLRLAVTDEVLYGVTHAHDCWAVEAVPERGADFRFFRLLATTKDAVRPAPRSYGHVSQGDPIPEILPWFPNTDDGNHRINNGAWAIDATNDYVVVGGDFTLVNNHARSDQQLSQQSLTAFAARGTPESTNLKPYWVARPTAQVVQGGVQIGWQATWSPQNDAITYEVIRNGQIIHTTQPTSSRPWYGPAPWVRPTFTWLHEGATSGMYYIRAVDPDGERTGSSSVTVG